MVSFFWNFFEFHELCSIIFRVALLFICQGTSKADRCAIILESLLSQNVLCNEMLCDSTQRAVFFCKLSLLNLLAIRRLPNGEGGIWTLAPLLTTCTLSRGVPSASLGTSPNQFPIIKLEAERVGFEPTRPCGQTVFKTASLWPLRYLSKRASLSGARYILPKIDFNVNNYF